MIISEPIRKSWDPKKNLATNISSMGLVLNPNEILKKSLKTKSENSPKSEKSKDKTKVIEDLEAMANKTPPKKFRFGPQTIKFCVYMIEKYGEDYKVWLFCASNPLYLDMLYFFSKKAVHLSIV